MRKLKLVKVVNPEIVAAICNKPDETIYDYRCPACGVGVGQGDNYCSGCGSELDWTKLNKPSKEFKKLVDSL